MDERDRQILALLKADAWLSYVAIARRIHLSASAVQRRVEKLKADGVLLGAKAVVDGSPDKQGQRVYALVELADDRSATVARFKRQIEGQADVIEAHYVAGEADVILTLNVAGIERYDAFVRRHFGSSPLVRRFKSLTSLRALVPPK
jgi:DNA-binding Lrp family transcriptional regulator